MISNAVSREHEDGGAGGCPISWAATLTTSINPHANKGSAFEMKRMILLRLKFGIRSLRANPLMQAFRDQWHDLSRYIDRGLDMTSIREVTSHIDSTHIGLKSFRIVDRHLGQFPRSSFYSQTFQQ